MNTLGYLQFFDGLAEKAAGSFSMERISSKLCTRKTELPVHTYICNFQVEHAVYRAEADSRKEALRGLYRQLQRHQKKF